MHAVSARSAQIAWALLLAAVLLALAACSSEIEDRESVVYPAADPLIFEIANKDGGIEGWMLGTIHALPAGVDWRTAKIDQVVAKADLLLVEVASLGQNDAIRQAFVELSQSPDLPPLTDRVAPELRGDLDTMIDELGTSRAILRSSEDWAAAIMLSRVGAPGDPAYGVDRALIEEFQGRRVVGFETAREQLGIFDRLAAEDQQALLEGTVREWSAFRGERDRLVRAWLSGDTAQLEEITTSGIMADPELRASLLTNRNDNWIGPIEQALEDDPLPLIAVGAAHLVGPEGLAAQIEARGYTVTRVR